MIKMYYKNALSVLIVLIMSIQMKAQETKTFNDQLKSLNNYVLYVNEINNYLPIFNSILVDFNMNLNKYVDLPNTPPSSFSNALMPDNIFDDVFLNEAPNAIYARAIGQSERLSPKDRETLNKIAKQIHQNSVVLNGVRFDIEKLINTLDLTKRENLSLVYDKLELASKSFKDFRTLQIELEKEVKAVYGNIIAGNTKNDYVELIKSWNELYAGARNIADAIYTKEDDDLDELVEKHKMALSNFEKIKTDQYNGTSLMNTVVQSKWKIIINQSKESVKAETAFVGAENIPEKYKLYDKYYYYYNHILISKINRFGIGIASEMNEIINQVGIPIVHYFEIPQMFKVIYPKLLDQTNFLTSSDPVVKTLPKQVKGREVIIANRTIKVDSFVVEFEVYDHMIVDNDIVSISFNGDWILEKHKLTAEKHKFTIKLNDVGKNFLLLYADDMGRRPPATIALAYYYQNKRQEIILKSDDKKSEIIEILVDN